MLPHHSTKSGRNTLRNCEGQLVRTFGGEALIVFRSAWVMGWQDISRPIPDSTAPQKSRFNIAQTNGHRTERSDDAPQSIALLATLSPVSSSSLCRRANSSWSFCWPSTLPLGCDLPDSSGTSSRAKRNGMFLEERMVVVEADFLCESWLDGLNISSGSNGLSSELPAAKLWSVNGMGEKVESSSKAMSLKSDSAIDSRPGGFSTNWVAALGERNASSGSPAGGAGIFETFVASAAISKQLCSKRRKGDHGGRGIRCETLRCRWRSVTCRDSTVSPSDQSGAPTRNHHLPM